MKRIPLVSLLLWTLCPPGAGAGEPAVPSTLTQEASRLRDSALSLREAAAIVQSLTDEVGPRLSGSPGGRAAEEWAIQKLSALGLTNVHGEPLLEPHWERGVEEGEVVSPHRQKLVLTALGGSPGTGPGGLEAAVLLTEDVSSLHLLLEKEPGAVRGKIVFFNKKMERTRDGSGYGRAVGIRGRGPLEAAKGGALGVLIRTVGTSSARLPHTGAIDTRGPVVPAAALSGPDADFLERLLTGGASVKVHLTLTCRTLPEAPARNIVGDVRGDGRPEEIVLLGAHLDSWDLGQGAIDDGAGVGIVVEAAHLIAHATHAPRRTVRVVLFANEENGTRGAKAYAEAHKQEADRHIAALEMDFGTDRVYGFSSLTGPEGEEAVSAIFELLRPLGVTENGTEDDGGTDISQLRPLGVPLFSLRQDGTRYFDIHHSADDTFDKIDPVSLQQAVAAVVTFASVAADLPGTFGRVPVSKRALAER
jgi:carboxypeptidase Q